MSQDVKLCVPIGQSRCPADRQRGVNCFLGGADEGPGSRPDIKPVVFRCPTTGRTVQHFIANKPKPFDQHRYDAIRCAVCSRAHLINRATGKRLVRRIRSTHCVCIRLFPCDPMRRGAAERLELGDTAARQIPWRKVDWQRLSVPNRRRVRGTTGASNISWLSSPRG